MRGRYLKRNHTSRYPSRFIFFDTETYRTRISENEYQHTFRLGYAIFWRRSLADSAESIEHHAITNIDVFFDWVVSKANSKDRLFLLAHNVQFDAQVLSLFDQLAKRSFRLRKFITDYGKQIWLFRNTDRTIIVADTLNWFKSSLKDLGKSVGKPKLNMPTFESDDVLWREYCRNDVEILLTAMQQYLRFLEANDLGTFGLTLPAQAFNAFRHRFMHHDIVVYKDDSLASLARRSYFGGRCEAFRIGEFRNEPFYQLDVNSLYPFVMRSNQYPVALVCFTEKRAYIDKALFGDIGKCIADVVVSTKLPVVPFRTKHNLIFPVGTFKTTLAGPELKLCVDLGIIKKIQRIAVFDTADIFTDYVDFFYSNRLQAKANGDKASDYLHKLFMNSLYGKFGQKQQRMRVVAEEPGKPNEFWYEYETETGKTKKFVRLNGSVIEYSDFIESHYAIPHIASFVTSYARVHLLKLIMLAGWENVFYVDTDSLIVNVEGYARLREFIDESKLGYLKLEMVADKLSIYGAKAYELGEKVKMRGIRADAVRIDENDARRYKTYEFFSLMRNLARGLNNAVIERHFIKQAFREYRKGIVNPDGFVEPFRF
jgi:hypothetical protein